MMIHKTFKAISNETFHFRAKTIGEIVNLITEEAAKPLSTFTYIDAACMFLTGIIKELDNEAIKLLAIGADKIANGLKEEAAQQS